MRTIRYSIRELFWLILVASLAIGWWLDHSRFASQQLDLEKKLGRCEGRRDDIEGRHRLLLKTTWEFVNKPGYEEFTQRMNWYVNEVRND
jgi:hypothetical protein